VRDGAAAPPFVVLSFDEIAHRTFLQNGSLQKVTPGSDQRESTDTEISVSTPVLAVELWPKERKPDPSSQTSQFYSSHPRLYPSSQLPYATIASSCQRSKSLPFKYQNALCSSAHLIPFPDLPSLARGMLHNDFLALDLFRCCVLPVPASRQRADKQPFTHRC